MIPDRLAPQTYALMRIFFGLMFLTYGLQKWGMFGGVDGKGASVPLASWPFGVAGLIEVTCGVLILIGLLTKLAAFVAAGEMAVAYFWVHLMHGIEIGQPQGPLPVMNGGMPAVLFCFGFLFIASRGGGLWSADGARGAT